MRNVPYRFRVKFEITNIPIKLSLVVEKMKSMYDIIQNISTPKECNKNERLLDNGKYEHVSLLKLPKNHSVKHVNVSTLFSTR